MLQHTPTQETNSTESTRIKLHQHDFSLAKIHHIHPRITRNTDSSMNTLTFRCSIVLGIGAITVAARKVWLVIAGSVIQSICYEASPSTCVPVMFPCNDPLNAPSRWHPITSTRMHVRLHTSPRDRRTRSHYKTRVRPVCHITRRATSVVRRR